MARAALTRNHLGGHVVYAILELHRLEESRRGRRERLIRHGHVAATQTQCLDQQGRGSFQILEGNAAGILAGNGDPLEVDIRIGFLHFVHGLGALAAGGFPVDVRNVGAAGTGRDPVACLESKEKIYLYLYLNI